MRESGAAEVEAEPGGGPAPRPAAAADGEPAEDDRGDLAAPARQTWAAVARGRAADCVSSEKDRDDNAAAQASPDTALGPAPASARGAAKRPEQHADPQEAAVSLQLLSFDPWRRQQSGANLNRQRIISTVQLFHFKRLDPDTDLRVCRRPAQSTSADGAAHGQTSPDEGFGQEPPGWAGLWQYDGSANVDVNTEVLSLLDSAFDKGRQPDVIGSSQSLKALFSMPYTDRPVSVFIHRVGRALLVESAEEVSTREAAKLRQGSTSLQFLVHEDTASAPTPNADRDSPRASRPLSSREEMEALLHERLLEAQRQTPASPPSDFNAAGLGNACSGAGIAGAQTPSSGSSSAASGGTSTSPDARTEATSLASAKPQPAFNVAATREEASSSPVSSSSPSSSQSGPTPAPTSTSASAPTASASSSPSWNAFRRTLSWKFDNVEVVVGSKLLVFQDPESEAGNLSVRLHDASERLSGSECLDFYLENRLAGVQRFALCLHSHGRVRDWRLYATEDIPRLEGHHVLFEDNRKLACSFSPQILEQRAAQLLAFLRERLVDGHTYWLFKGANTNQVHLCQPASSNWMYSMAMLSCRMALSYEQKRRKLGVRPPSFSAAASESSSFANPAAKRAQQRRSEIGARDVKSKGSRSGRGHPKSAGKGDRRKVGRSSEEDDEADSHAQYLFFLHRERELLVKSLEILEEISTAGGPSRDLLQASLHEKVAQTYLDQVPWAQERARERAWKQEAASTEEAADGEVVLIVRAAVRHWHKAAARLAACPDTDALPSEGMKQSIRDLQARLQETVFGCYMLAARAHVSVGKSEEAIRTLSQGLSGHGTFDRWFPDWVSTHKAVDVVRGFSFMGDVLMDLSKRALRSSNRGPGPQSSIKWLEYSEARCSEVLACVSLRKNARPSFSATRAAAGTSAASKFEAGEAVLRPAEHSENTCAAEVLVRGAMQVYAAAHAEAAGGDDSALVRETDWKLGNACNELGKILLRVQAWEAAKDALEAGVERFAQSEARSNAIALLLNLNHLFRGLGLAQQQQQQQQQQRPEGPRTEDKDGPSTTQGTSLEDRLRERADRLKDQETFIQKGTDYLEQARRLAGNAAIELELGMNEMIRGVWMRGHCAGDLEDLDPLERRFAIYCTQQAITRLRSALAHYEPLQATQALANQKGAAAHYHLGAHFAWIAKQRSNASLSALTTTNRRLTRELAARHFRLALAGLPQGPAQDQCRLDLAALQEDRNL